MTNKQQKILALLVSISCTTSVVAQEKFTLDGFVSAEYGTDITPNPDALHFGEVCTTMRPIIKIEKGSWFFTFEPSLSLIHVEDSNWLLQAMLGYKVSDDLTIQFGRIMTSSIYLTPAGRFNPLVRCPRVPIGVYGYGVQIVKTWGDFKLITDFTADTGVSFQNPGSDQGFETSSRLSYAFNENWSLAGDVIYDFTTERLAGGFDAEYKNGPFDVRLVGYAKSDQDAGETFGSYVIATYRINELLEVHAGLDIQSEKGSSQTIGGRVFFFDDKKTDLAVDYIHGSDEFGFKESTVALRLRKRF
jgi:hypothetical protein